MVWNIIHRHKTSRLHKENQSLLEQVADLRGDNIKLQKQMREMKEEMARTRLDMEEEIKDLQDQLACVQQQQKAKDEWPKNKSSKTMKTPREMEESSSSSTSHESMTASTASTRSTSTHQPTPHAEQQDYSLSERHWTKETTSSLLSDLANNEQVIKEAEGFESTIIDGIGTLDHGVQMLRRIKAVGIVGRRMALMTSESEKDLYEEVSRLIVALFHVERCSYTILVDGGNAFVVMKCAVVESGFSLQLQENQKIPIQGSAMEHVRETGEFVYAPDTSKSCFKDHQMISSMGLKTAMNAPVYVDGSNTKLFATLNIGLKGTNDLTAYDQLLIAEVARMLGENLYLKRLKRAEKESQKISQELLYSLCPEPVIKKIKHHWERHMSSSTTQQIGESKQQDEEDRQHGTTAQVGRLGNNKKMKMIANVTRNDNSGGTGTQQPHHPGSETAALQSSSRSRGSSVASDSPTKALYAEDVYDVCIVFADIVGFSKMSMKISPMEVMDMLQELFSKFDALCEKHNVLKLETIGDGFLGATGLLEEERVDDDGEDLAATAPQRALAFAKDLVRAANTVRVPLSAVAGDDSHSPSDTISVRVGVHCGDATCGVLGQSLPKFSVFGQTVNMAARMEQSCTSNHVHVSDDFFHMVKKTGECLDTWAGPQTVTVKNMGEVKSWICDPRGSECTMGTSL